MSVGEVHLRIYSTNFIKFSVLVYSKLCRTRFSLGLLNSCTLYAVSNSKQTTTVRKPGLFPFPNESWRGGTCSVQCLITK